MVKSEIKWNKYNWDSFLYYKKHNLCKYSYYENSLWNEKNVATFFGSFYSENNKL